MATVVKRLKDAYIELDGTDYSEQVTEVEMTFDVADEDVTTFVNEGWTRVAGTRKSGKIDIGILLSDALTDFLWDNLGDDVSYEVRASQETVSSTNPSYSGTCMVGGFKPISGKPSDVQRDKITLKMNGKPDKATSES